MDQKERYNFILRSSSLDKLAEDCHHQAAELDRLNAVIREQRQELSFTRGKRKLRTERTVDGPRSNASFQGTENDEQRKDSEQGKEQSQDEGQSEDNGRLKVSNIAEDEDGEVGKENEQVGESEAYVNARLRKEEQRLLEMTSKISTIDAAVEKLELAIVEARNRMLGSKLSESHHRKSINAKRSEVVEVTRELSKCKVVSECKEQEKLQMAEEIQWKERVKKEKEKKGAKRDKREEKMTDLSKEIEDVQNEICGMEKALLELAEISQNLRDERNQKLCRAAKLDYQLWTCNNGQEPFGPQIETLIQRVEEAQQRQQFHMIPLGPLGQYVYVREPKWVRVEEEW